MNSFIRMKLTLTADKPIWQPLDQDLWATMADYQQKIAFKPTPTEQTTPTGTGELPNIIPPFNIYRPLEFDMLPESKDTDEAEPPVDANVSGK